MAFKELSCATFELCLFFFSTIITIMILLKLIRRSVKLKSKDNNIVNLPPSPRKLPIIGNLHQIGALPYHSFKALSDKYGDVMLLQLGHIPTVVVSSAQVMNEITTKGHDLALSNRAQSTATNTLLYGSNDIGFANYGESWKQKRKICVRELLSHTMVQSESIRLVREGAVAELVDKVREAAGACSSVNLSELIVEAANNIICNSALGLKNDAKGVSRKEKVKKLAKKVMFQVGVVTIGDHFPWLSWIDVVTGKIQQFKDTFQALDPLFDDIIAEGRSSIINRAHDDDDDDDQRDFVDILLQLQHQHHAISNLDIKSILLDMFVAGSETTSVTVEWAMTELMKNPIELKKVQEEVRRIVGQKSNVEESNVNQMEYLKWVVKETLRLHPPGPLLVPRVARRHVKLRGYDIPANTRLYVNAWAIQRDPQVWDNPEEFIPERHRHSHNTQDFKLIPFGFGRRGCPGMNFGLASVEYMLANLLYHFNWESPQDIDMSEIFGLVAFKRIPLHLKPVPFSFK